MSLNCQLFIYQLTTNFWAKYQLTTIFWANCQLTVNPISTLLKVFIRFWCSLFPKICFCSRVPILFSFCSHAKRSLPRSLILWYPCGSLMNPFRLFSVFGNVVKHCLSCWNIKTSTNSQSTTNLNLLSHVPDVLPSNTVESNTNRK